MTWQVKEELFGWRQHPRQHTRTHGRLSVESLRKLKVHFLLKEGGVARGKNVQVLSVGKTLDEWVEDLNAYPQPPLSVEKVGCCCLLIIDLSVGGTLYQSVED